MAKPVHVIEGGDAGHLFHEWQKALKEKRAQEQQQTAETNQPANSQDTTFQEVMELADEIAKRY